MSEEFDIVVIGGGHAGAEAAHAAAALGASVALVTLSRQTIAAMSCNPAIGGVGKGQLVREIDALGGLMGLAADATGIQFRMLNRSKGPAVWGPRCQSDRHAYARWVQDALAQTPNLTIIEAQAVEIVASGGAVRGVTILDAAGRSATLACRSAIVTAGTFLNGVMHLGEKTWPGGRYDEPAANALSESLRRLGLVLERLKTGTCPRLHAESIDYDRCVRQDGDDPPIPFSSLNSAGGSRGSADWLELSQQPCWLTATNPAVHDVVRANLHRAPMYTGQIQAVGPRYCPSFETKITRFADKDSHQLFLEAEGLDTPWVYVNGLSTSLPPDVQEAIVHCIPALEKATILRYGYAIEYDFAPPTQLDATLQAKAVRGLYLAGQLNGTTGYEEAAALGLMAGLNAAAALVGRPEVVLRRDQAYIGVMIDDLITKGVNEPYRMFTSRSEHRLHLRADNADRRLTPLGRQVGLADANRWQQYTLKTTAYDRAVALLQATRHEGRSLWQALQRPDAELQAVIETASPSVGRELADLAAAHPSAIETLVVDARYEGYLRKEQAAIGRMRELDDKLIPAGIDYAAISQLRHEARQKLSSVQPRSLGQALRISGITPADVTVLAVFLTKGSR